MNRIGVIAAPNLAASLRPHSVTVIGGTGSGFLVDVAHIKRKVGKVDGIVIADQVERWTPIIRWVNDLDVPVVMCPPNTPAAAVLERLEAGGDRPDGEPAVMSPKWAPPPKKKR